LAAAENTRADVEERPRETSANEVADPARLFDDVQAVGLRTVRCDVGRGRESRRVGAHADGRRRGRRERRGRPQPRCDHTAARSSSRTQGPGGINSCSTWRYASATRGASVHRSKQTKRGRHAGKNLRLKLWSRSSWKKRSKRRSPARSSRRRRGASRVALSAFANTAKLSDSSLTSCSRAQPIASTIRNSISPFGV